MRAEAGTKRIDTETAGIYRNVRSFSGWQNGLLYWASRAARGQERAEYYLLEDGELNRKKIAMAVFDDPGLLKKLTEIVHPAVKQKVREEIEQHASYELIVVEAALLLDDHYDEICDEIWYIYASEKVRRQRLKSDRGYSDERIDEMFRTQRKEESFRELTDLTIDNSSDIIQNTCGQIDRALRERGFFPKD